MSQRSRLSALPRGAAVLLSSVLLLVLLGGCEDGCSFRRPPAPPRSVTTSCAPPMMWSCLGDCVTPRQLNDSCSMDECSSGAEVCADGLTCVPGQVPGAGTCQQSDMLCDPDLAPGSNGNRCPNSMVCVPVGPQQACATWPRVRNSGFVPAGICRMPAIDGEGCDSDWTVAEAAQQAGQGLWCLPCAPGLKCLNNVCTRTCDSSGPDISSCLPDPVANPVQRYSYQCVDEPVYTWLPPSLLHPAWVEVQSDQLACVAQANLGQACPVNDASPSLTAVNAITSSNPFGSHTIVQGPMPLTASASGGLCADTHAACVDGACCLPPSNPAAPNRETCSRDSDCCGGTMDINLGPLGDFTSFCCGTHGFPNELGGTVPGCVGQANRCITCGGGTGIPSCTTSADCASNQACVGGCCLHCGDPGEPCCAGSTCGVSLVCGPNGSCGACGGSGQPCCHGYTCHDHLLCDTGVGTLGECVDCGRNIGDRCCPANGSHPSAYCDSGLDCNPNAGFTCETASCGHGGEPCCDLDPDNPFAGDCARGFNCNNHTCSPCGSPGGPCCYGYPDPVDACLYPTDACNDQHRCVQCGGQTQICCDGHQCGDPGFLGCDTHPGDVNYNHCVPCGTFLGPCCAGSTPCQGTTAVCINNSCVNPHPG